MAVLFLISCLVLLFVGGGNATGKKPSTPWGGRIENNVELISMRHRSNTKFWEITYVIV